MEGKGLIKGLGPPYSVEEVSHFVENHNGPALCMAYHFLQSGAWAPPFCTIGLAPLYKIGLIVLDSF